MKVYIRAATVDYLKESVGKGIPDDVFEQLVRVDPTSDYDNNRSGRYWRWVFNQYKNGTLPEDEYQNVSDALGHFAKSSKRYKYSDIGKYATAREFLDDAEDVATRPLTEEERLKLLRKQAHRPSDADKEFCVADGDWEVWKPLTHAGSISLAREGGVVARWCTAYDGNDYYWRYYTREGPLYIFINTENPGEKYQTHFENGSYMYDVTDHPKGKNFFYQFCEEHPAIGEYFQVSFKHGVYMRQGKFDGFDRDAKTIKIPDGVTELDTRFPSEVTYVHLPDSMTKLNEGMFYDCTCLKQIRLPETITELPSRLFKHCTSLRDVTIPNSVTVYGSAAFSECTSLVRIKHSTNLEKVKSFCFYGCTSLTDVNLPDSVKYLGGECFKASGVKNVILPDSVTTLRGTFRNSSVPEVNLNKVTQILEDTFRNSAITKVDLKNVNSVGSSAFRGCNSLTEVTFGKNITLGAHAFADNPNLKKVKLTNGCELSFSVFDNCPELIVYWNKEDMPYEFEDIKLLVCDESCTQLIEENKGIVKIKTRQGAVYDI